MCIVSSKGEVKRVIKDLPEIKMGFMTDLNRLSNGSTVICFYQGSHHVIGVTPEKKLCGNGDCRHKELLSALRFLTKKAIPKKAI